VVLVLVPALQEHPALFVGDLDQADHLGVVGRAQLEVRDPDLDVLQAQDAVAHSLLRPQVWKLRNRWLMTFS
jgi:hypothetical protein